MLHEAFYAPILDGRRTVRPHAQAFVKGDEG